jgi:hypothetical protein
MHMQSRSKVGHMSTGIQPVLLGMAVAVAIGFSAPPAKGDCNGSMNLSVKPFSQARVGDTRQLVINMGAGTITDGVFNVRRVSLVEVKLDCERASGGSAPDFGSCVDDGTIVTFVAGSVGTSLAVKACQNEVVAAVGGNDDGVCDAGETCVDITWTPNPVGNLVTFTPSAPVVIPQLSSGTQWCGFNIDVTVQSLSTDGTPYLIDVAAHDTGLCDQTPDPGSGDAQQTTQINLAAVDCEKICGTADATGAPVSVTVTNPAVVSLVNCNVDDALATNPALTPQAFSLAADPVFGDPIPGTQVLTGKTAPLTADALNSATVTCSLAGSSGQGSLTVTDTCTDPCSCPLPDVKLCKQDTLGGFMNGVEMTLTGPGTATTTFSCTTAGGAAATDSTPAIPSCCTIADLTPGTYTVSEPNPPAGYEFVAGSCTALNPLVCDGPTQTVTCTNCELPDQPFCKKDTAGVPMNGVVLEITGPGDATDKFSCTTTFSADAALNGCCTIVDLQPGDYSIAEPAPLPTGYKFCECDPASIVDLDCGDDPAAIACRNCQLPDVKLCKLDSSNSSAQLSMNGIELCISSDGLATRCCTTVTEGCCTINDLALNGCNATPYTVTEPTAPAGYERDGTCTALNSLTCGGALQTSTCRNRTSCVVEVDKQVSCTGADNDWHDVLFTDNNDGGTNGPPSPCPVGSVVFVRYFAKNVGLSAAVCTLFENSTVIQPGPETVDPGNAVQVGIALAFNATVGPIPDLGSPICNAALTAEEPDTATLNCTCARPGLADLTATAFDTATIECSSPCQVQIVKDVAEDRNCDGNPDINDDCELAGVPHNCCTGLDTGECDGFVNSVSVDKLQCVVYRVCIDNTGSAGSQDLDVSGVTLNDDHLGIVALTGLDFGGPLAWDDDPRCLEIPSSDIVAGECPGVLPDDPADDTCVCQVVEGTNEAIVSNIICLPSTDPACDEDGSDCADTANVSCVGGCRITAGRTNRLGQIDTSTGLVSALPGECNAGVNKGVTCFDDAICTGSKCNLPRGQGGGQVGAPCGCSGCFTSGDPEADLAFERIQGNWQYDRKDPTRPNDLFKNGTFHAKEYNSLICGCCSAGLPNCTEGVIQTEGAGACFIQGASSDALDGLVCGDDIGFSGPRPRPAGANIICFSGMGDWVDTNGRKTDKVAFRVEAEDRSEPSVGKNAVETCDYHRIRIWFPQGTCGDGTTVCKSNAGCGKNGICTFAPGESPEELADASCCTTPNEASDFDDNYGHVPCLRYPDIDDGGNLRNGNIQIHPPLPNTEKGKCPVSQGEEGSCQQPDRDECED